MLTVKTAKLIVFIIAGVSGILVIVSSSVYIHEITSAREDLQKYEEKVRPFNSSLDSDISSSHLTYTILSIGTVVALCAGLLQLTLSNSEGPLVLPVLGNLLVAFFDTISCTLLLYFVPQVSLPSVGQTKLVLDHSFEIQRKVLIGFLSFQFVICFLLILFLIVIEKTHICVKNQEYGAPMPIQSARIRDDD